MKDKKTLYILIPLVILIWGYVGYKFFTFGNDEDDIDPIRIETIIAEEKNLDDKLSLTLNYRDPFLKNVRNRPVIKKVKSTKSTKKQLPNIDWGNVIYNGFMNNSQKQKKIALMNIDGKMVLGEVGEKYNGIDLLKIKEDSILIGKNQASKWIIKSN